MNQHSAWIYCRVAHPGPDTLEGQAARIRAYEILFDSALLYHGVGAFLNGGTHAMTTVK